MQEQSIEFEREKLRKLKEVFLVSLDKTQNPRFFLRDFVEYCKKVLALQLNVARVRMDERVQVREDGLVYGLVETALL